MLQSMGSQRVGQDWVTQQTNKQTNSFIPVYFETNSRYLGLPGGASGKESVYQ